MHVQSPEMLAGIWECCWCRRVQVSLAAVPALMSPLGLTPSSENNGKGLSRAAVTCHEAGERICVGLCGEGKQKQGRSTVRQGRSWSGSSCKSRGGQM